MLLEGCGAWSGGARCRLDLSQLPHYRLFPGQVSDCKQYFCYCCRYLDVCWWVALQVRQYRLFPGQVSHCDLMPEFGVWCLFGGSRCKCRTTACSRGRSGTAACCRCLGVCWCGALQLPHNALFAGQDRDCCRNHRPSLFSQPLRICSAGFSQCTAHLRCSPANLPSPTLGSPPLCTPSTLLLLSRACSRVTRPGTNG